MSRVRYPFTLWNSLDTISTKPKRCPSNSGDSQPENLGCSVPDLKLPAVFDPDLVVGCGDKSVVFDDIFLSFEYRP
jgi:hypothetical protein